ncbi:MAG: hypothetical protein ACK5CA_13725 [Cyanobacteriota bacterium]|jgi:hypothetical protein
MTTHFITAEIPLQETPEALRQRIEATLGQQGEPLRWAIAELDLEKQTATLEAVVTRA